MPYTILVYTKREREQLHKQGIWLNRNGQREPLHLMSRDRIEKLVKMLALWSMEEDDAYLYLKNLPIFPHLLCEIERRRLDSFYASMFTLAGRICHY
jgi:hypothetical protein